MREGLERIKEETGIGSFAAYEYTLNDTVNSLDSKFYEGVNYDERRLLKEKIISYGEITNKSGLGYKGIGALIVFPYNTPNCTLPVIWGDKHGWIPLFRRSGKITGIASIFDDLKEVVNNKIEEEKDYAKFNNNQNRQHSIELDLYVEGNTDSELLKMIVERYDLNQFLGYSKINVITAGGAILSNSIIEASKVSKNDSVFILDSNTKTDNINVSEVNVIVLEPSMTKFIDLEKTYDAIDFERPVPSPLSEMIKLKENNEQIPEKLYYDLGKSFTQIPWFIYLFKHEELFNSKEVEKLKQKLKMMLIKIDE